MDTRGGENPQNPPFDPQNPIKNPINGRAANGCEKTLKSAIFSPKIGLFDPKIATIDPKYLTLALHKSMGWKKPQKSHILSPKNPIKNPITATAVNGGENRPFLTQNCIFSPQNRNN